MASFIIIIFRTKTVENESAPISIINCLSYLKSKMPTSASPMQILVVCEITARKLNCLELNHVLAL